MAGGTISVDAFEPIPDTVATVTDAGWLARALTTVGEGDVVTVVDRPAGSRTIAEKVHLVIEVERPGGARTRHPLCIKGHFGDEFNSLHTEAHAYSDLLGNVPVRSPQVHYVAADDESKRGLIVMDDIVALGGRILSAHDPYPLDVCRASLGALAALHAATWADDRWNTSWLEPRMLPMADMFGPGVLANLLADGRADGLPGALRDGAALHAALQATAARETTCVVHGDTHSGNAYLNENGQVGWLDWQITQRGHWSIDVAYHLGTVLDVEGRRAHERELLEHYLSELSSFGAPAPSFDEAFNDYASAFSWGYFLWAITSVSSRAVVEIHLPRLGTAMADHDTYGRLGIT